MSKEAKKGKPERSEEQKMLDALTEGTGRVNAGKAQSLNG